MSEPNPPLSGRSFAVHAGYKLSSGRYAWCVGCLLLFVYLAGTGKIPPEQVMSLVTLVVGFYFGQQNQREGDK